MEFAGRLCSGFHCTHGMWAIGFEALIDGNDFGHRTYWEETVNSNSITLLFIWSLRIILYKKIYETDSTTNSTSLKFSNTTCM